MSDKDELIEVLKEEVADLRARLDREQEANRSSRGSWWKDKFGAAMVGMLVAFGVLAANGDENPLRLGGEEQAGAPPAAVAPAPIDPAPTDTTRQPTFTDPGTDPAPGTEPVSGTYPAPTDPVQKP